MYPIQFGVTQVINNELLAMAEGDVLLPSMKHLKRRLYGKIRALGLTPLKELTFRTDSSHCDYFVRNQTIVLGETYAVAVPIPW